MHLLLPLSCALLLWSVWSGDAGSTESPPGSASVLLPPSRDASSSGRETHLRLLPGDGCTPKTQLQEVCSATVFFKEGINLDFSRSRQEAARLCEAGHMTEGQEGK